jgi:16S rRNA (cytidine1402-2'-O)-methyltransferase
MISDPGFKIARDCHEQNIDVFTLPGANAVLPALQLSGFASDQFTFAGFLPVKAGAKEAALKEIIPKKETVIFYETAPRLIATLQILDRLVPDRRVAVIREITKKFESAIRGTAQEIITEFQDNDAVLKGEIVFLIDGAEGERHDGQLSVSYDVFLEEALKTMSVKDATKLLQALSGAPKKEIYDLALRLKEQ